MLDAINRLLKFLIARLAGYSSTLVRWSLVLVLGLSSTVQIIKDRDHTLINSSYDKLLELRLLSPKVDPSILVLDIDERSLDEMRSDYGRWPWPRETLAGVLRWLESQGVRGVVFDILFADQDILNPLSDKAFAEAVAQSQSSFFPILRLDSKNDSLSEVTPGMLPGFAVPIPTQEGTSQSLQGSPPNGLSNTLAVIPPVFEAIIQSGRTGYHNIYPDPDGVNRTYTLWEDIAGWRLLSLPARIASHFNWDLPSEAKQIIRYPQEPLSHRSISFVDAWKYSQSGQATPPEWLKDVPGAIVIIGSTAPSLFDIKVTPISPIHPGVHVLATAIDNLKNQSFQGEFPMWAKLVQCWLFLLGMAWLSKAISTTALRWAILIVPSVLLSVSYLSLQIAPIFLDFSLAASQAVLFFSLLTLYFSLRLQHFTTASGSFLGSKGFEAFFVIFHREDERAKPQSILDDLQSIKSESVVMQSGWIGYELEKRLGPTFIWLRAAEKSILDRDIQSISKLKFLSADLVWQTESLEVSRSWESETEMFHFAWSQVGTAFEERGTKQWKSGGSQEN